MERKPKFFDYGGRLWSWFQSFWSLIVLNVLFVVGCLPVITIGTSMLSLTELAIVRRREGSESLSLLRPFWQAYRRHLRRGIVLTFGLALVFGSLFLDYLWVSGGRLPSAFIGVLLVLTVLLTMITLCYLPLMTTGRYSMWDGLVKSFFDALTYWKDTLPAALLAVGLAALFLYFPNIFLAIVPVLLFIGFAVLSTAFTFFTDDTILADDLADED